MSNRENFSSRLGFLLVSAGCAIGLGNVWKFPYICGQYGGAAFIVIYLIFLAILGVPVMMCEFAVGRASKRSIATSFERLEPKGTNWHNCKFFYILGSYILMAFYTVVSGWILYYCFKTFMGSFKNVDSTQVTATFTNVLSSSPTMLLWTYIACIIGFAICIIGVKNGVEKISKIMMIALLVIMIFLAIYVIVETDSKKGLDFYLIPDWERVADNGIGNCLFAALSHAFFTLSIGMGAMQIMGSYMSNKNSIGKEALTVAILDTVVAITAGLIIIPTCFAYGLEPGAGPGLIFVTLPNIFAQMPFGSLIGGLFFLFMSFAAFSTLVAVYENLIAFNMDLKDWSRTKSTLVCMGIMVIAVLPCIFGFNILEGFQPFGEGSNVLDLEDFIVSNNILPLGSLIYILFCSSKFGWGFDSFTNETNVGKGVRLPKWLKYYMQFGVTSIVVLIFIKGYYDKFANCSVALKCIWYTIGVLFLAFIAWICFYKKTDKKI